jgi:hypothetical protein
MLEMQGSRTASGVNKHQSNTRRPRTASPKWPLTVVGCSVHGPVVIEPWENIRIGYIYAILCNQVQYTLPSGFKAVPPLTLSTSRCNSEFINEGRFQMHSLSVAEFTSMVASGIAFAASIKPDNGVRTTSMLKHKYPLAGPSTTHPSFSLGSLPPFHPFPSAWCLQ